MVRILRSLVGVAVLFSSITIASVVEADTVRPQVVQDLIDRPGVTVLVAGIGSTASSNGDGGPSIEANLSSYITDIAVDSEGNVYVSDRDWRQIRRIDGTTGVISSVFDERSAAHPTYCGSPHTDPITGSLGWPWALETRGTDLYYSIGCGGGGRVLLYKRTAAGAVSVVAGGVYCPDTTQNCTGDGGPAVGAGLGSVDDIEIDADGNIYIADFTSCRIRKIDAGDQVISTVAGTVCGNGDVTGSLGDGGPATSGILFRPFKVQLSNDQSRLFVLSESDGDRGRRVRAIDLMAGTLSTVAGTGAEGISGDGGLATDARIYPANSIAVSATGELLIFSPGPVNQDSDVETPYSLIRSVGADGKISTFARLEGPWPKGGTVGPDGSIFVVSVVTDSNLERYYQLLKYSPETMIGWQAPTCTISGTAGDDDLVGTSGNDVICGLAGNDSISGNGGNDIIFGGEGDDLITCSAKCIADGGPGNDTIDVGDDGGSARGGSGDDVLEGGDGRDSLVGDGGRDRVEGGSGVDFVDGGDGNDHLWSETSTTPANQSTAPKNYVSGGPGDDWTVAASRDVVFAGAGTNRCSRTSLFRQACTTAVAAMAEVPAAPRYLRSVVSGTTANLTWRTPSTSEGQSLTYSVVVGDLVVTCAVSSATSCSLSGLSAGATVAVKVRATNSTGTGSWSTTHTVKVPAASGGSGGNRRIPSLLWWRMRWYFGFAAFR